MNLADNRSGSVPIIIAVVLVVVIAVVAIVLISRGGETAVETEPFTSIPPEGWVDSDEVRCWEGTAINPDTSRCVVDEADPATEYIYVSLTSPHSGAPLPQISYVHVAVPDAASDEQVGRVFDSYVASQPGFDDIAQLQLEATDSALGPGWQLGMDLFVVRNYSDVVFGDFFHGRDFTGGPRIVYAAGPGGVVHGYNPVVSSSSYGTVVHESGRDGTDLPQDCIAIDLSFTILSQSTVDQLEAYYAADSPFWAALNSYIELGGGYGLSFPESASQKRSQGDAKYDILIKLYRMDAGEYYLANLADDSDPEAPSEDNRQPELPSIAINGCQ